MTLVEGLSVIVGPDHVITEPTAQRRFLQDFSWYSPMLTEQLAGMKVDAVTQPGTMEELREILGLVVRLGVPVTLRGAGTGNYGQSVPLAGGVLIDTRRLDRILAIDDESVTVEAGAIFDDVEKAARLRGRELRLMPTTRHLATVAGFLSGGWGGIGSVAWGNLRDDNVLCVDVLTVEDPPRTLRLRDAEAHVMIHTAGTAGVITTVTLPLAPARDWQSAFAAFDDFEDAARFSWRLALDQTIGKRLLTLQEAPIPSMFLPVKRLYGPNDSVVYLILAREDVAKAAAHARECHGTLTEWPPRPMPEVTEFTWAHTILWSKKHDKRTTWLQLGYSTEPERHLEQWRAIKARFGGDVISHLEYMALPRTGGAIAQGGHVIRDASAGFLADVTEFCNGIGVHVMNPHSVAVDASGLVTELEPVRRFKKETDPHDLLNRGKLGAKASG